MALPFASFVAREVRGGGFAITISLVQHLTLLFAFVGALLAAREDKLLRLATRELLPRLAGHPLVTLFTTVVSAGVCGLLARAAFEFVRGEREWGGSIGEVLPIWWLLIVMPVAFFGVGLRLAWKVPRIGEERAHGEGREPRARWEESSALRVWGVRVCAVLALLAGVYFETQSELWSGARLWPWVAVLLVATALGAPLFVPLGGAAVIAFLAQDVPGEAVIGEMYSLTSSPFLPAVPLFTLAGLLLTEGGAARRLLEVFRASFGWMPGGTAVLCTLLCAFFSVFTGGSGVTILALGGVLFAALKADGYAESFSVGLLTSSGSLGLLLPPALPLILYGIAAQVPIEDLFRGGILPGLVLISLVTAWGVFTGVSQGIERRSFSRGELLRSLWRAKFELALPFVTLAAIFSGWATLVEASALTALFALVSQTLVQRDVSWRGLGRVFVDCGTLLGGVLVILCAAKGLTNYLVDAEVPMRALEWIQGSIDSPLLFLLSLNVFLLLVGCFLDIYSATFVVVPLLLPLGAAYDIDPVHLGIIFVANLELGYLTPPVGLNLFVASYRFDRPILSVYRAALPFLLILAVGVLLVTYVPWLSTALL